MRVYLGVLVYETVLESGGTGVMCGKGHSFSFSVNMEALEKEHACLFVCKCLPM